MHAYAAEDPVFRAMNKRGQRETNGELGDFCVQCHAPLAVAMGLTEDGLNLDDVPSICRGSPATSATTSRTSPATHNNPLTLAMDDTMRGALKAKEAVENDVHDSD